METTTLRPIDVAADARRDTSRMRAAFLVLVVLTVIALAVWL